MPKEPITKTMKWLLAIGGFALCGVLYFAIVNVNDEQDGASINQNLVGKKKTATVTPTTAASDIPADWKTYTNARYNYTLRYPSNWQVESSNAEKDYTKRGPGNELIGGDLYVTNHPMRESSLAPQKSDITIGFMFYQTSLSFADFFKKSQGTITERKDMKINGKDALQFTLTSTGAPVGQMEIFTLVKVRSDQILQIYLSGGQGLNKLPDRTNHDIILSSMKFSDATAGWKTYTNNTYKYSIQYPQNWDYKVISEKQIEFRQTGKTYSAEGSDVYAIGIFVSDNPNNQTAIQVAQARQAKFQGESSKGEITSITAGGTTAAKFVNYLDTTIYLVRNGKTIQIVAPVIGDNTVKTIYEQMLPTFQFTN